jgi:hypothetical protein
MHKAPTQLAARCNAACSRQPAAVCPLVQAFITTRMPNVMMNDFKKASGRGSSRSR